MTSDLLFFISVFSFIFIVWVATGGPERPISFSGPYLYPITNSGVDSATAYGDGREYSPGTRTGSVGSVISGGSSLDDLKQQVENSASFGTPSPYRGQVTIIHSTSGPSERTVEREYLTLSLASSAKQNVTISGWVLVSTATGAYATIPEGTDVARSGSLSQDLPITLTPGDTAIIATDESPIGDSFRENICTGYLSQYQHFNPSLSNSCPAPSDIYSRFYRGTDAKKDDACYDYIRSINRCSFPSDNRKASSECRNFAEDYLNYNGCVDAYRRDKDFSKNTWRVFLNKNKELWRTSGDTIKLLDSSGKTVDVFSY